MDEQAVHAARERVALADRRLVALQEAGVDTAALVSHLAFARAAIDGGRLEEAMATVEEVLAGATRLADGGIPTASLRRSSTKLRAVRAPGMDPEMMAKAITVHELDRRIEEAATLAADARMLQVGERLASVAAAVGGLSADVARLRGDLERSLEERFAAQAADLRRQAAAAAPAPADLATRADLEQLGEALRKDLDWQVERAAAERGWCTMADVDAALSRALPAPAAHPEALAPEDGSTRLELVLSDFVRQLQAQQERLIDLVQAHPRPTPAEAPTPAPAGPEGEGDLDALTRSSQFRVLRESDLLRAAAEADQPAADEVGTRMIVPAPAPASAAPAGGAAPADPAAEPPAPAAAPPATDPERIVAAVAAEMAAQGGSSKLVRSGELRGPLPDQSEIDALIDEAALLAEHAAAPTQRATTPIPPPQTAPPPASVLIPADAAPAGDDAREAALRERVLRLLPEILADGGVRQRILALVATEALQPGVLGELTGIRAFIRREIRQAAEEVAAELRRESARERQPA